jgi:hypothetical protein
MPLGVVRGPISRADNRLLGRMQRCANFVLQLKHRTFEQAACIPPRLDERANSTIVLSLCSLMTMRGGTRDLLEPEAFGTDLAHAVTGGLAQVPAAQAPSGFSFSPSGFGAPPCATSHRSVPLDQVYQRPHRHHIGVMDLDLSDEKAAALTQELHDIVESDRYPFSPRASAP